VMGLLRQKETEYEELVGTHDKSVREAGEMQKQQATLEDMINQLQSQMKQLRQEVEAKSDLVCVLAFSYTLQSMCK